MNLKEYQEKASRTCADLGYREKNDLHMALGLATEAGEFADIFKRNLAYKTKVDYINAAEEIGDIFWYAVNFCRMNNISLEEILEKNIMKLAKRYPEKFTEYNALNRDLDAERSILES
jgi:NTP pyrophosphatase (non-canonical NTP hydrolase)